MPAASQPLLAMARRAAQRDVGAMRETALRLRYDWAEVDPAVRQAADNLMVALASLHESLDRLTSAEDAGPSSALFLARD